jgi:hypothetical protein
MLKHIINQNFPNKISNISNITNLENCMLTVKKKQLIDKFNKNIISTNPDIPTTTTKINFYYENEPTPTVITDDLFKPKQKDSLFWCIYILKYGFDNYYKILNYGNTELQEKSNCLKHIDKNISFLRLCNFKITNVKFKEIKSELITQQVVTSYYAICAFICFYKFNIYIIHESKKSYIKFINENNDINHILLKDGKHFKIMKTAILSKDIDNFTKNMYCLDHFDKPIKSIGSFKVDEIISIAKIFNINVEKKKKSDLYRDIQMNLIWD